MNTGMKHVGSSPLSLVPAVACAALGSCRPRQESEDSAMAVYSHAQSMQEAAAGSIRRLWDRAGEANEEDLAGREQAGTQRRNCLRKHQRH